MEKKIVDIEVFPNKDPHKMNLHFIYDDGSVEIFKGAYISEYHCEALDPYTVPKITVEYKGAYFEVN